MKERERRKEGGENCPELLFIFKRNDRLVNYARKKFYSTGPKSYISFKLFVFEVFEKNVRHEGYFITPVIIT